MVRRVYVERDIYICKNTDINQHVEAKRLSVSDISRKFSQSNIGQ